MGTVLSLAYDEGATGRLGKTPISRSVTSILSYLLVSSPAITVYIG